MCKTCIWVMVLLLSAVSTSAQRADRGQRGRIENVTDKSIYSPNVDIRKVGSIAKAPLTCIGSPKVPVILVQFPDLSFKVGKNDEKVKALYHDFFNAEKGVQPADNACSVREYFRNNSDGQFTPQFDIIGPVTLSKSYTYYGADNRNEARDIHISELYQEACQAAKDESNTDWSLYDNNHDRRVDFVFFIYAGQGQNQEGAPDDIIWPKESTSSLTVRSGGSSVTFAAYGCSNELLFDEMDGIGSSIHELCHGMGLPDFYDTNDVAYGLDYWDVMDAGCYKQGGRIPVELSAYERDFFGWRSLVELEPDEAYSLTLQPLEKEGVGYQVVNRANFNEYFILENRQNIGTDVYIGWQADYQQRQYGWNHGLMITHVDYNTSSWNNNTINTSRNHQRITLVPADGELIPSLKQDAAQSDEEWTEAWAQSQHGDLYPSNKCVTEMSSYSVFRGGTLKQTIDNIVEHQNGIITLDINGGNPEGLKEPDVPEFAKATLLGQPLYSYPSVNDSSSLALK